MKSKPVRVVLVDDRFPECEKVQTGLRSIGFETESHSLRLDDRHRDLRHFDVALMRLSTTAGVDLAGLACVKQVVADLPVVVVAEAGEFELAEAALSAGAKDWLTPDELETTALHRTLKYVVNHHRLVCGHGPSGERNGWQADSDRAERVLQRQLDDEAREPHGRVASHELAMEQALQHYTQLLKQVTQLAEQVGLAEDHLGIYRALLELARTSTPADSLLVSHLEPRTGLRHCVYAGEFVAGKYEEFDVNQLPPMPPHDSAQSRAISERRAIITDDLLQEEVDAVDFGVDDDDQPARSSLAIPLVVLGEVLGVFEVQSTRPGAFGDEHVAMLQMASNLAAIASKNVDLLARQKKARREAEAQAARLESVLEQAPALVATSTGPEHIFTNANDKFREYFGGRELVGRRVVDAIPEVEAQGIVAILDDVYSTGDSFASYELPMDLDRQGSGILERHYFDLVYQPLRNEGGLVTGILAQCVDITAQVEARKQAEQLHATLQAAYDETIEGWARALDLKDEETAGHSQRVTDMTVELSRRMGMSDDELVHVRRGALLHDIGKMGVPDRILLKPGKLLPEEWEIVKRHADYAKDFLDPIDHLKPALDIPYCHHERWDGGGYPRGLAGEEIPLAARVFAIVDVYDALTSDRPYRAAWRREKVLAFIEEARGTHFDPAVVDTFQELIAGTEPAAKRDSSR